MSLLSRTRGSLLLCALRGTRAFSSDVERTSDKVYEMRTYTIKPDRFIDYLRLTYDHISKRIQHSKLCGFWSVDLGGTLSEVVHIWEYDSYSHRSAVRKALSQDDKWQTEYIKEMFPMLVRQDSITMRAAPWYQLQKFMSTGGIYELTSETILPGKCDQLAHRWMMGLDAWCKQDPPVGIWFSELGPKNRVHTLRSYESIDERCRINEDAMKDEEIRETVRDLAGFVIDSDVKILTPTSFSPWK